MLASSSSDATVLSASKQEWQLVPNPETDVIVCEGTSNKVLRVFRAPVSAVGAYESFSPNHGRLRDAAGYDIHLGQQLGPGHYRFYRDVPGILTRVFNIFALNGASQIRAN